MSKVDGKAYTAHGTWTDKLTETDSQWPIAFRAIDIHFVPAGAEVIKSAGSMGYSP